MARSVSLLICFSLVFVVCISPSEGAGKRHALLVGVSDYPGLEQRKQLPGARNDVLLMRRLLQERGFEKENIRIVAEGIEGGVAPTREGILRELGQLIEGLSAEDFVYLHLSGHGSQQPEVLEAQSDETDGLDEIFLPSDIGRWDGKAGTVKNAITDNELKVAIAAMRGKGAFVWAVFDNCHSGTITRGAPAPEIRYRKLDPSNLGIPSSKIPAKNVSESPPPLRLGTSSGEMGGYVAFFAAQSTETTPEMKLPIGHQERQHQGLFTYTLAEILAQGAPITYRQAAEKILHRYNVQRFRLPTPLFEGTHLDAPLWGTKVEEVLRQWPVKILGDKWSIPAGELHRIGKGSTFLIVPDPAATDEQAIGKTVVTDSTIYESSLLPLDGKDKSTRLQGNRSQQVYARLLMPAVDMRLRVAAPEREGGYSEAEKRALALIDELATDAIEGIQLEWVEAGGESDLRLAIRKNRLWLLSPQGELIAEGARKSLSIGLEKDQASLKKAIFDSFRSIAKVTNLLRNISSAFEGGRVARKIELELYHKPAKGGSKKRVGATSLPEVHHGDKLWFVVRNKGRRPIDLTLLLIDSHYGIGKFYPEDGEINRIQPEGTEEIDATLVAGESIGLEQMLAIAVEATPRAPSVNFAYLAQDPLAVSRGQEKKSTNLAKASVEALFQDAGFETLTTRSSHRGRSQANKTAIGVFSWLLLEE